MSRLSSRLSHLGSQSTPSARRKVFRVPPTSRRVDVRRQPRLYPGMRSVSVRVPVPVKHAHKVPDVVRWKMPSIKPSPRNHNRVRLNSAFLPIVWKRVRVDYPRALPVVPAHYAAIRRGKIVLHSVAATNRLLAHERNRARKMESKGNRRQARNGHLGGAKHDRYGMIGAGVRAGLSTKRLSDIAMVSNSIGG